MYARMKLKKVWLFAAAALMTASCKDYDESVVSNEPVSVELAYTLSSSASGIQTRQASEAVQTNGTANPRWPQQMRLIPLITSAPQTADISWEDPVEKPGAGSQPTSRLYRSHYCNVATNVNGFLVYGSVANLTPPSGVHPKVYNGSLEAHFPPSFLLESDLNRISFNLESIYNSTVAPTEATAIADYLTGIANTSSGSKTWGTATDENLQNLFKKFTNFGKPLPGSAASIKKWVEAIKTAATGFSCTGDEETIRQTIAGLSVPTFEGTVAQYPRNYNLPDGAAVLQWADVAEGENTIQKFVPQMQTTTLDNITSVPRFAYPAALYYFGATDIITAEEDVDFKELMNQENTDAEKTAWDKILSNTKFTADIVTPKTKAIALKKPVQYAVAQLNVRIKAMDNIKDDEGTVVDLGTNNFPLTGIIVCDQRPVNNKFEQETESEKDAKFIYDSQVKTGCYLTTTEQDACTTLVLENHNNEDVYIILELENNSSQEFKCVDGIVYPNTRFYLIGKVDVTRYNPSESTVEEDNRDRVFTKDYITTVIMTVSSMAKAYNVPPNLLSNNLEIGVETTPQWVAATPTGLRLD